MSVRKLRFRGQITPDGQDALCLAGQLGATVIQRCVVSFAPVTTRIDMKVAHRLVPRPGGGETDLVFDPDEGEETDFYGPEIDLGLIATEQISLALPDYPRAAGAKLEKTAFAAPGTAPISDAELRPFSQLAALRDRLKN